METPSITFGDSDGTGAPRIHSVGIQMPAAELRELEREIRLRYTELAKLTDGQSVQLATPAGVWGFTVQVRKATSRCPEIALYPITTPDVEPDLTSVLADVTATFVPHEQLVSLPEMERMGLVFALKELVQMATNSTQDCLLVLIAEHLHLCRRVAEQYDPERASLYRLANRALLRVFRDRIPECPEEADSVEQLRSWAVAHLRKSWGES